MLLSPAYGSSFHVLERWCHCCYDLISAVYNSFRFLSTCCYRQCSFINLCYAITSYKVFWSDSLLIWIIVLFSRTASPIVKTLYAFKLLGKKMLWIVWMLTRRPANWHWMKKEGKEIDSLMFVKLRVQKTPLHVRSYCYYHNVYYNIYL